MFTVTKNGARSRKIFLGLATLTTLSVGSALAEDGKLEEIIVTASKRETNLMQTPSAERGHFQAPKRNVDRAKEKRKRKDARKARKKARKRR